MYATVGQDGFPAGPRHSGSFRDRAPTPTGSLRGTNPESMVSDTGEPLYAQVRKVKRSPSKRSLPDDDIGGSSAMRRFNEEDDATFKRGSRRGSRRSRRSRSSIEEQIESQLIEKTYSGSGLTSGLGTFNRHPSSGRSSPYSHAASPRLNTLRLQNADLLKKQRGLEQQLAEQQERQQELIDRLVQRGLLQSQDEETNSMLQETQNELTDCTEAITQIHTELQGILNEGIAPEKAKVEIQSTKHPSNDEAMGISDLESEEESTEETQIHRQQASRVAQERKQESTPEDVSPYLQRKEVSLQNKSNERPRQENGTEMSKRRSTRSRSTSMTSMTDRTIKKTDELYRSQQERISVLEAEKHELVELNEQLQAEIYSLKKMASYRGDDDDEGSTQLGLLKKQLSDMKDESTTLRSGVHRLNVELSRYQAKFRPLKATELKDSIGLPGKGSKPQWLIDTKYLAPLFVAYDDIIEEKDEAVREYREEMELIKQDIDSIIKENKRLHLRIEQSDATGGPISMTEWRQLQEQCKLVLEENQLLMEQLDVQQNKAKDMHRAHMQEVTRLSKRVAETESEKAHYETQFEHIKHKLRISESHTSTVTIENLEDQVTAIADLKRMLEDEKIRHKTELENNLTKIQTLSAARKSLTIQLEDFQRENKELSGEVKALQKAQRKSHRKVLLFQSALEEAEIKAKSSEHYLKSVVRVAENTAKERDILSQSVHDKDREKKLAINKLIEGNVTKTKMEEKLQLYKCKASDKLEKAQLRMREQDDDFNMQRQEFHREILHLRNMIKEREQMMETVILEKKCVEDDLETMWQVASHDNKEMKNTLRHNIRKLKTHEGLRHIDGVAGTGDDDMLLSCTDDEGIKAGT